MSLSSEIQEKHIKARHYNPLLFSRDDSMMQLTHERLSVFMLSATHGMQHFFGRIFPPLIPLLATDLQLPLWKLGLLVTVWSFSVGLGQTPMGHLSDRFDRRFILPTGVAIVGIGYLTVAAATMWGASFPTLTIMNTSWTGTLTVMAIGMIIAGIGKSATHPTGYPLLSANVSGEQKGKALGRWGSAAKLGDAFGPAFVGVTILVLSWQEVFAAIGVLGLVYAVILFTYMTRSALTTAPLTRQNAEEETTATEGYWTSIFLVLLSIIAASFAIRGIGTYLPTFITRVYGFSFTVFDVTFHPESVASMYFSAVLLAAAATVIIVGNLSDRKDPRTILVLLFTGATAALAALAFLPLSPITLLIVSVFLGATLFATSPARDAIITQVAPAEREGRIFGYFWTALLLVSASFPVIIGYLSDTVGIQQGFAYLGIGTLVAILPILVLYRMNQ